MTEDDGVREGAPKAAGGIHAAGGGDGIRCPSCGAWNRLEATFCRSCRKGLNLKGRMAAPWGREGCLSRVSWTWLGLTGSGCLLLFLFPPLGLFLLVISAWAQIAMGRSVAGVCPHCKEDTATARGKAHGTEFRCVHCENVLYVDLSSGAPVFVKERPEGIAEGASRGRLGPQERRSAGGRSVSLGKRRRTTVLVAVFAVVAAIALFAWRGSEPRRKVASGEGTVHVSGRGPGREVAPGGRAPASRRAAATPEAAAAPRGPAGERVLSFHSDITVHPEGHIDVRETIVVRAEGRKIRRGIYRDFPTTYRDRLGNNYRVSFNVLGVERDGRTEPWHTRKRSNGIRVYIGEEKTLIPAGVHRYSLRYRTLGQLGFFDEYDELYWNVTGNGWEFPIDEASCTVSLPPGAPREGLRLAGYTGRMGSRETAVTSTVDPTGGVTYRATRPLGAREGLTVAVGWPKGFVTEPTAADRATSFMAANRHLLALLTGTAVLCLFYFIVWNRVGRDPEAGVVVPLFEPPRKLSPAAVRYIRRMGFDNKSFAATVLDMAVKGYLEIRESAGAFSKGFVLSRKAGADETSLSRGQRAVARRIFPGSVDILILERKQYRVVGGALKALKKSLETEYVGAVFTMNSGHLVPGVLISLATLVVTAVLHQSLPKDIGGMMLWLTMWTAAVVLLWARKSYAMAVIFTLAEAAALVGFSSEGFPFSLFTALVLLAAINLAFFHLLKAPTSKGRRLMDEIEGYRTYLAAAEGERLRVMNPPEKTPELFERHLPYALALDVDHEWAEQFAEILARAGRDVSSGGYRPSWYQGSRWNSSSFGNFAGGLGSSLTAAISSSSTPPGSSSGSGGGGSSGGGGGGGGGGGW